MISIPMNRHWNLLNWNVRGINSQERWDDLRFFFEESNCGFICLQETKREIFDNSYLRKLPPRRFSIFAYCPWHGSSGGIITIWNGNLFNGTTINQNNFQIAVKLNCVLSKDTIYITNVYGPCHNEEITDFINWLSNVDTSSMEHCMILGISIWSEAQMTEADQVETLIICYYSIVPFKLWTLLKYHLRAGVLHGAIFKIALYLKKLDWVFTSTQWTIDFPNTLLIPLARITSGHIPIHVQIGTDIPKASIFRFENYWM